MGRPGRRRRGGRGRLFEGHVLRPAAPSEAAAHARAGHVATSGNECEARAGLGHRGGELDMTRELDLLVQDANPVAADAIDAWRHSPAAAAVRARTRAAAAQT